MFLILMLSIIRIPESTLAYINALLKGCVSMLKNPLYPASMIVLKSMIKSSVSACSRFTTRRMQVICNN